MGGVVKYIGRGKAKTRAGIAEEIPMWKRLLAARLAGMLPSDRADALEILNYAEQLLDVELKPAVPRAS